MHISSLATPKIRAVSDGSEKALQGCRVCLPACVRFTHAPTRVFHCPSPSPPPPPAPALHRQAVVESASRKIDTAFELLERHSERMQEQSERMQQLQDLVVQNLRAQEQNTELLKELKKTSTAR